VFPPAGAQESRIPGEVLQSAGERRVLFAAILVLALLTLAPIWTLRFLPMQDYPQHLVQAQMVARQDNPTPDLRQYYDIHLRIGPYVAFYAVTATLARLVPIEVAGKIAISIYVLLGALLAAGIVRRSRGGHAPWGVLLLFPLMLDQHYYLGNVNYLYSVPLLALALLDHERATAAPITARSVVRYALWVAALFAAHPYTLLVYGGLAALAAFVQGRDRSRLARGVVLAGIAWIPFAIWQVLAGSAKATTHGAQWIALPHTLEYLVLPFTGMTWQRGVDAMTTLCWSGIGVLIGVAACRSGSGERRWLDPYVVTLAASIAGLLFLPFRIGDFSFINLRLASIAYVLSVLVVSRLAFRGAARAGLLVLALALLGRSYAKQARIGAEIAEVLPVIERMQPNARVLPLVFDPTSPELEAGIFDAHLHDHVWYHVLVGGGYSPYFPDQPLTPVHVRNGAARPAPGEYTPDRFNWEQYAADYRYFLVRSGPPQLARYLDHRCRSIARSGSWELFERSDALPVH
jgi:hypothetical protein